MMVLDPATGKVRDARCGERVLKIAKIAGLSPRAYAARSRERKLRKIAAKMNTSVVVATPFPRVDANLAEARPPDATPPPEHLVVPLTEVGNPVLPIIDFNTSPPWKDEPISTIDETGPPIPKVNPRTMSTVEST